jgi:MATE family multidrug resistance protein
VFSGATLKELFRLALPMVVSQSAFALMVFTDRLFMSRIDAVHIAAALGGGVSFFVSVSLFLGLISYATALVAQYLGAGHLAKCPRVVTQGAIIALLCQPLLLIVAWLSGELFALMGHEPAQVQLERTYYFVLMAGSFLVLLKTTLASYFTGIGRTRVVMIADVLGVLLNIPLTYALVFGKLGLPQLGIAGAALATVVANAFTIGVYCLFYFNRIHRQRFAVRQAFGLDPGILRRYLRLGLPSGFESFVGAATFNFFLLLFQSYGVTQGAAMAIVFNWDMLNFVPLIGMNIAVTSMIGRYVGAGDMTRTNEVIAAGFLLAVGYSLLLGSCFILFREQLLWVFATPEEDFSAIAALGSDMMTGLATYVLADAVILISSGVLRGAGDTRWLMNTSMLVHVLMLICQLLIIKVLAMGPMASWWTFVVMLLSLALLYLWRLLGRTWRQPERLARIMAE